MSPKNLSLNTAGKAAWQALTYLKAGEHEDEIVWLQDPMVSPPAQVQPQQGCARSIHNLE